MTDRRPIHLAVLVGVSASAYAASLAGVTALQSATDTRIATDRAPAGHAADVMSSGHDELDTRLDEVSRIYATAANRYAELSPRLTEVEGALDRLGQRVEKVSGAANALPGRVSLPQITVSTRTVSRTVTKTKVVHATTGASG